MKSKNIEVRAIFSIPENLPAVDRDEIDSITTEAFTVMQARVQDVVDRALARLPAADGPWN